MRILFFTRLYLPHVGGVEKHIHEISKILSTKNQITIVTEQHDPDLPLHEIVDIGEVHRIPCMGAGESGKKWCIWSWLFRHLDLLRNCDLIHIHDVFFWFLPFRFLFPFKKLYITFHGYEGTDTPNLRKVFWHCLAAKLTSGNICIGGFHKKWYGVNPSQISYGAVNKTSISLKKTPKAVFLGRLAADTGIMDYLKAVKLTGFPLDIYGEGPQEHEAREYVKQNKLPVIFYGFVSEASARLSGYSVGFISRYLGILEALSTEIPVIAHYNNAIKYDYLHLSPFSGNIWLAGNPLEIKTAITEIQKNGSDVSLKITGGKNWVKSQTWSKLAAQYLQLWQAKKSPS